MNSFNQARSVLVHGRVVTTAVIHSCKCTGYIGLKPDGTLVREVAIPGVKPCYLLDCIASSGESYNIAYDSKEWLFTDPFRKLLQPGLLLGIEDKTLFDEAVGAYVAEHP